MINSTSDRLNVLLTAGPTQEPLDAVRYLGNRSSGRMGIALAEESARRGHATTLLLGPTALIPTDTTSIHLLRFRQTDDLQALLKKHWPDHDVLIMAAAVADFRPRSPVSDGKIRREGDGLRLDLEPTPDLLADLAFMTRPDQTTIGFALEATDSLQEAAREKLIRKKLDAVVANPLRTMEAETIAGTILLKNGSSLQAPGELTKAQFAAWFFDQMERIRAQSDTPR